MKWAIVKGVMLGLLMLYALEVFTMAAMPISKGKYLKDDCAQVNWEYIKSRGIVLPDEAY